MEEKVLKTDYINIKGGKIPIKLIRFLAQEVEFFAVDIDGVEWLETSNQVHACILFELLRDNVTKYMSYTMID